jgi:hypothetical protein
VKKILFILLSHSMYSYAPIPSKVGEEERIEQPMGGGVAAIVHVSCIVDVSYR